MYKNCIILSNISVLLACTIIKIEAMIKENCQESNNSTIIFTSWFRKEEKALQIVKCFSEFSF